MSSTRSRSPAAQATECLIVSHGSPSDPDPQEGFVSDLATAVSARTGISVRAATLAKEGSLAAAVSDMIDPVIFPHFMSDGWFVSVNLPRRLAEAGLKSWNVTTPLGMIDGLPALAARRSIAALGAQNLKAKQTTLVVAAHGSPSDPAPARATEWFASLMCQSGGFRDVRVGYVDEEPSLAQSAAVNGPAIVLPFFASRAGHVLIDIPEALEEARFDGTVLPPIGTWPDIPDLIGEQLSRCAEAQVA